MAKPPSSTVLLLELEGLKEHMSSVQAEVDRCVASMMVQSKEVCKALFRLETVGALVRNEQAVNRNNRFEEELILQEPALERFIDTNHKDFLAAVSVESCGAFREITGNRNIHKSDKCDVEYRDEGCFSTSNQSYKPVILKNKSITVKEVAAGSNEAVQVNNDASETTVEENGEISDKVGFNIASLDMPPSTRPSLSKKNRKNVKDMKDLEYNDEATTVTVSSSATLATKSMSIKDFKIPSSSTGSTDQTSSSVKMSTTSMVNMVKNTCREKGWKVTGSYSNREGKEGCGAVHFCKLEVKGGVTDLMTRGVGESKVEAVRGAFKTMMNKLIGVDWKQFERVQMKSEDAMCDNIVDFPDEEPMMKVDSKSSSDNSLSPPPLFPSKDCVALDRQGVKEARHPTDSVKKRLFVSENNAGLIIGREGTNINRIRNKTGVDISVGRDLVRGRHDRLVELVGENDSVDKALEMINKTLKGKENLATLAVSDSEAGHIIGKQGSNINKMIKETGAQISVGGLVKGRQDRLVEVWGQEISVGEALERIKEIIQK